MERIISAAAFACKAGNAGRLSQPGVRQARIDSAGRASPKPEIRNPKELRNPKSEFWRSSIHARLAKAACLQASDFELASDFDLRILGFPSMPAAICFRA
jgi:hypothetical protein